MHRKLIIAAYTVFFLAYYVLFEILGSINVGQPINWKGFVTPISLSSICWSLLIVLLAHYLVFKKWYGVRPRWKLFTALAALLVFQILFRYLVEEVIFRAVLGYGNYSDNTTFRFYIVDNIYFGSIKIFIGFVFFLLEELFLNRQRQALLRKEKQEAELGFLRAQFNPHFLFNSLNNIYGLAYEQHPQTAAAVLKLSEIMRYITYEKKEYTTLQQELEYVQNMLELHQLRCDYKVQYQVKVSSNAAACAVMPLLLIPLVENALKHGDLSDAQHPLEIIAEKNDTRFELWVCNKIATDGKTEAGGIGLKNLSRRLELSYPREQYTFEKQVKENIFTVQIKLKLS
jgi:two-component system, LytTR family, sensor kinase